MQEKRATGWISEVGKAYAFICLEGDGPETFYFGHWQEMPDRAVLPIGTYVSFNVMPRRDERDSYDRAVKIQVIQKEAA